MIKGVLFDLDGTILNTNELIIDSFFHTFKMLNKDVPSRDEIISYFGEPLIKTMSKFFDDPHYAVNVYREFNLKYHDERIEIYDNAKELLEKIKVKGIKNYIVTSKNFNTALRGLKHFDLDVYFEGFITSESVENHKPHPEPVIKACENLKIKPSESLMVGDSIYDIISGRDAGARTCGVCYSLMRDKLKDCNADFYVDNLIEILDII